jgi:hypothetical protein
MTEQPANVDPAYGVDHLIVDAVDTVRNRFGATGLRQLIAIAEVELADTQTALKELHDGEVNDG